MESYTLNTFSHIHAMIQALPEHYEMSLNERDMVTVIDALSRIADSDTPFAERALDLLSSISETLGVEGI